MIIPGRATVSQADALDWLPQVDADVVYSDSPYGGTQAYEQAFALVDEFLGAPALPPSRFSSREPPLDALLDACRQIPVLVLSANNSLWDRDEWARRVGQHRHVDRVVAVSYRHYGALATRQKNATNREFLILATPHTKGN